MHPAAFVRRRHVIVGLGSRHELYQDAIERTHAAHAELVRHDEVKSYATALAGHSEGGLLVLAAAPTIARHKPHAMVLMGTPGRALGDVVRGQIERTAPPPLIAAAERAMSTIAASGHVPPDLPRELDALFMRGR